MSREMVACVTLQPEAASASSSSNCVPTRLRETKLAEPLAEDDELIRRMKPSLIKARARGRAPTNHKPGRRRLAPSSPQLGARPKPKRDGGGPSPWIVVGAALVAGIVLAKWIDWRGHAHPRD